MGYHCGGHQNCSGSNKHIINGTDVTHKVGVCGFRSTVFNLEVLSSIDFVSVSCEWSFGRGMVSLDSLPCHVSHSSVKPLVRSVLSIFWYRILQ